MHTTDLINFGSKILKEKLIPSHRLDSELILSNVLKKSRENMLISLDKSISKDTVNDFNKLLNRRDSFNGSTTT